MEESYDVVVLGGGPSGMMAAGTAAARGARVLLLEKNNTLGKKLLITGGGRCNVTNAEFNERTFLAKFKGSDKFLFSAFSQLNVEQTLQFFNSRGMETKVEAEKRAFPVSDSAQSVWDVLVQYMKDGDVTVQSNSEVTSFISKDRKIESVQLKNGKRISAKSFVLATGGKSRPETGSTGDGFRWLKELGHKIFESNSALVPVVIKDEWVKKLQGLALPEVKISVIFDKKVEEKMTGKVLFTHFGLSGPGVLNLSKTIGEFLQYGDVTLSVDLLPKMSPGDLNLKLQEIFKIESNKKIKNALESLFPSRLAMPVIESAGIKPDTFCHSITREERLKLANAVKSMSMEVSGLLSAEKAIVTSGGLELSEVDFKTMRSKLYPNLHVVGDVLNIDRPSGGYSLQLCWTTGFVAGSHVEF